MAMIMTEADAKDKLCPMAMSYPGDTFLKCKGSGCMAWVEYWVQPTGMCSVVPPPPTKTNKGYCGMVTK